MRKIFCAAALLVSFATPAIAAVTFDFYETAVTSCFATCSQPAQPLPVLSVTLSQPTETGSAVWAGFRFPYTSPIVGDPGFVFRDFYSPLEIAAPDFGVGSCSLGSCSGFLFGYNISWSDTTGELDEISISFAGENDEVFLGLTGGTIGSDGEIGTCGNGRCIVTGFWQNVSVPEPGSAVLLLSALFGLALVGWRYKAL